jgi:hypothetical protein
MIFRISILFRRIHISMLVIKKKKEEEGQSLRKTGETKEEKENI